MATRISVEEQQLIKQTVKAADKIGYGNLIAHLKTAWAKKLMDEHDMCEQSARMGADAAGMPFTMHTDCIEGGFWDETGERYRSEVT